MCQELIPTLVYDYFVTTRTWRTVLMLFDVYVFKCQLHSTWCGQNETALKITRNNSTKIEFVHCPLRE